MEKKRLKLQKHYQAHTLKHKPLHHAWWERERTPSEVPSQRSSHLATIHYNSACLQGHMTLKKGVSSFSLLLHRAYTGEKTEKLSNSQTKSCATPPHISLPAPQTSDSTAWSPQIRSLSSPMSKSTKSSRCCQGTTILGDYVIAYSALTDKCKGNEQPVCRLSSGSKVWYAASVHLYFTL